MAPLSPTHQRSSGASRTWRERTPDALSTSWSDGSPEEPTARDGVWNTMPSCSPMASRAANRGESATSGACRRELSTENSPARASSSSRRRKAARAVCSLSSSANNRERLSCSAPSARPWNSSRARNNVPSRHRSDDRIPLTRPEVDRRSQVSAVTGTSPVPVGCGCSVPR